MASGSSETEEGFAGRIFQLVTDAHLCMSVSLGVQTGLFEKMAEWDEPKSSQEIAEATDLKERYVREWLGAMVTGKIIEISSDSSGVDKFLFPPHRRMALTRAGLTDSSAAYSLSVPALAEVHSKVVKCFKKDGPKGISYSDYNDVFWISLDQMTEDKYKKHLLTDIVPAVPGFAEGLESGARVLDLGCGTGSTSLRLANAFPNCSITAVDYSDDALEMLRAKARDQNITNITVAKHDASKLPSDWAGTFDFVLANDMVHDTAQPDKVLHHCYEVLKPDGTFIMSDVYAHTSMAKNIQFEYAPMVYNFGLYNCMTVSLGHGGMGLGAAWGIEKAEEMVRAAGFTQVELKQCPTEFDALFISKKSP